jgi:hypothetical protein
VTKQTSKKAKAEDSPNKLCAGCRRTCKQPTTAVVASCPRYYPLHKKQQQKSKEWKQQGLFDDL